MTDNASDAVNIAKFFHGLGTRWLEKKHPTRNKIKADE